MASVQRAGTSFCSSAPERVAPAGLRLRRLPGLASSQRARSATQRCGIASSACAASVSVCGPASYRTASTSSSSRGVAPTSSRSNASVTNGHAHARRSSSAASTYCAPVLSSWPDGGPASQRTRTKEELRTGCRCRWNAWDPSQSCRFSWRGGRNGIIFAPTDVRDRALPHRPRARLPDRDLAMARKGVPIRAVLLALRGGLPRGPRRRAWRLAFSQTPV